MKRKLRGMKRRDIQLDFDLYRVNVPLQGVENSALSVIDICPEGAEKTIMFVHGYAGCAETWEFQINYFSRRYRVIAPDLRGHGYSDAPYSEYTMPEIVADLQTIVETLKLPPQFILAGHSFGGSVCVAYATTYPQHLAKLVLLATATDYPLPNFAETAYRLPTAILKPLWKYRPRWNAELHVMKRMMLNNVRVWQGEPLMRRISTPTLVITGERDRFFPRRVFDDVGKLIPGAEVYDVGSAKHKVQLERHRAVNRAIERFMEDKQRSSWREQDEHPDLFSQRPWLKNYIHETPLTVPVPPQPLHAFLESAVNSIPHQTATIFYGSYLTYRQLNRWVNQLAHALHGLGVQVGERVMVILPNIPQMIVAYYAILKIGGVVVLPNPEATTAQIIAQIKQTQPKILIALKELGSIIQAIQQHTTIQEFIWVDIRSKVNKEIYEALLSRWHGVGGVQADEPRVIKMGHLMHELTRDAPITPPDIVVPHTNLATIIFTSGTTKEPKGVCLSHANLVANAIQTRHWIPILNYGHEIALSVIPLMHSYGMTTGMNLPILLGATIILLPIFQLQDVLEHIKRYKPTIFPGVPSMYMAINQAPDVRSYGVSSIKACISGAAPLPIEVQEAFEKLTHGLLVEGYGLTETSPVTHVNPLHGVGKPGSIGVPIPNTEAKVVDLTTREKLPAGKIGELVVKGPQVMLGYWDAEKGFPVMPPAIFEEGWLYTGDIATYDNDGYFQIISRKSEAIQIGDHFVYPRDVEEVIYENVKVLEVAVVGILTAKNGDQQAVKAFVVPRAKMELSKDELLQLCQRRLEDYAVPTEIEFRDALPKSFVGKVLRRLLVDKVDKG